MLAKVQTGNVMLDRGSASERTLAAGDVVDVSAALVAAHPDTFVALTPDESAAYRATQAEAEAAVAAAAQTQADAKQAPKPEAPDSPAPTGESTSKK